MINQPICQTPNQVPLSLEARTAPETAEPPPPPLHLMRRVGSLRMKGVPLGVTALLVVTVVVLVEMTEVVEWPTSRVNGELMVHALTHFGKISHFDYVTDLRHDGIYIRFSL